MVTMHTLDELLEVQEELYFESALSPSFTDQLPENLHIAGSLQIQGVHTLTTLPEGLQVADELHVRSCPFLETFPQNIAAQYFHLENCPVTDIICDQMFHISLASCPALVRFFSPAPWQKIGSLEIRDCPNLTHVPRELMIEENLTIEGDFSPQEPLSILVVKGTMQIKNSPHVLTKACTKLFVGGNLLIEGEVCTSLPTDTCIGGSLYLSGTQPKELLDQGRQLKGAGKIVGEVYS